VALLEMLRVGATRGVTPAAAFPVVIFLLHLPKRLTGEASLPWDASALVALTLASDAG